MKKSVKIGLIMVIILICISALLIYVKKNNNTAKNEVQVSYIDVGQGDSILIKTENHSILIDAGPQEAANTVTEYIRKKGITKLDYVICSHPHEDHIGGMPSVLEQFDVGKVFMTKTTQTTATYEKVLDDISNKNIEVHEPKKGETFTLDDTTFTIISANKSDENLNNDSICIRLEHGSNAFFFSGDAEVKVENQMLSSGYILRSDVLKIGHHGSDTSTGDAFLKFVQPQYAIISVGKDNEYGHPSQSVINKLNNNGIKILRTDESGTITAISNGDKIRWISGNKSTDASTSSEESKTDNSEIHNYVINKNTGKFHYSWCDSVNAMNNDNKEYYKGSRQELIDKGYSPCSNCKP